MCWSQGRGCSLGREQFHVAATHVYAKHSQQPGPPVRRIDGWQLLHPPPCGICGGRQGGGCQQPCQVATRSQILSRLDLDCPHQGRGVLSVWGCASGSLPVLLIQGRYGPCQLRCSCQGVGQAYQQQCSQVCLSLRASCVQIVWQAGTVGACEGPHGACAASMRVCKLWQGQQALVPLPSLVTCTHACTEGASDAA